MIMRKIVIRFCNNIRHFSNEINKRGGGNFFLWRVEFFKIGKCGLHVYQRDESTWGWTPQILADQFNPILTKRGRLCPPHYYWHPWIRAQMVVLIKAEIRTGVLHGGNWRTKSFCHKQRISSYKTHCRILPQREPVLFSPLVLGHVKYQQSNPQEIFRLGKDWLNNHILLIVWEHHSNRWDPEGSKSKGILSPSGGPLK